VKRPFRFGVHLLEAKSAAEWAEKGRAAEALGYTVLTVPDHIGGQFAYAPALTAVAAATALRIGTLVLDNDFRHPALVASETATLDLLSDGRYELGIGAGWMQQDYDRLGVPFGPPAVRVQRLFESVRIVKGLLRGEAVTEAGRYYRVTDLTGYPPPVQRPHPPLLIGAGGRRMLAFAAREADIVSVIPRTSGPNQLSLADLPAAVVAEQVRAVQAAAGERFDTLELHLLIQRVMITDDRAAAAQSLAATWKFAPEVALDSPYLLIGTADAIAASIRANRERFGISYLTVFERDMDAFAPVVALLAGE
jgi:probable F420-dependent oxidoreductase